MDAIKKGLRWLGLSILLLLAWSSLVSGQGEGALQGQVENGTPGGPAVGSDVTVRLTIWQGDTPIDSLETVTDAEGHFSFSGLDTDPALTYRLEAVYLDVTYAAAQAYRFAEGETTVEATITVYETTDDDSAIALGAIHIIAESFDQVLRISEIQVYSNSSDRTYIGTETEGQRTTLRVPVPEGAVGLAVGQGAPGERFTEGDGMLLDTAPVPPGQEASLVSFSYHLMAGSRSLPVEWRFAYPVKDLSLLAAQPGLTVASQQLQAMGQQSFQGREYSYYVAQNMGPDSPLEVEFVLAPSPAGGVGGMPGGGEHPAGGTTEPGDQGLLRWLGVALVALALVGVLAYALASRGAAAAAPTTDLTADAQARALLSELADLEEARETGRIQESTYERRRAELVARLKSL